MGVTETIRHATQSPIIWAIEMIDPGESSRLLSLNQQSYNHGAQFIAKTVDGDYLQAAALWSHSQTWTADSKMAGIDEVSKLLSF